MLTGKIITLNAHDLNTSIDTKSKLMCNNFRDPIHVGL